MNIVYVYFAHAGHEHMVVQSHDVSSLAYFGGAAGILLIIGIATILAVNGTKQAKRSDTDETTK